MPIHPNTQLFKAPPTPNWNWRILLSRWVDGDPYQPDRQAREYYRLKHAAVVFTGAKRIAEIGVRAGYSAASFAMAGWPIEFVGIDNDAGLHGGVTGYHQHAAATLDTFPNVTWKFEMVDSQTLDVLPGAPFDLVHVDGDHTYQGCLNDIELCLRSGVTWILVDDIDFLPDVKKATLDALDKHGVTEAYYIPDGGYRGTVLFKAPVKVEEPETVAESYEPVESDFIPDYDSDEIDTTN